MAERDVAGPSGRATWHSDPTGRHRFRYWEPATGWSAQVLDSDPFSALEEEPASPGTAGWYPDPMGRFSLRSFDGRRWTPDVLSSDPLSSGLPAQAPVGRVDPVPVPVWIDQVTAFLRDARQRRIIDDSAYLALTEDLAGPRLWLEFSRRVPDAASVRLAAPTPPPAVLGVEPPVAPAPAPVPTWVSDVRAWWERTKALVRSDLAIHGLVYLGVLLLFAGVLGFVTFAFGGVRTGLRPVAEVLIPLTVWGAARFLGRHGSGFVAGALEVLGSALVPIVVIASFVDGASVPPDLKGGPLAGALAAALFVVAAIYAWVVHRRPASPVRFLVGPVAWLGVAMAALAGNSHLMGGRELARPMPWQMALTAVAVLVSAALSRRFRSASTTATEAVILPGAAVVVVLAALGAGPGRWPGAPIVLTGLAVLGVLELQAHRLGAWRVTVLQSLVVGATAAALAGSLGVGWSMCVGSVALVALAEWEGHRRPGALVAPLTLVPALGALMLTVVEPWAAVVGFAAASVWAHSRRARPVRWAPRREALEMAAAALPIGFAVGLFGAVGRADATVIVAALVAVVALAVRMVGASGSRFWSWWLPVAAGAVVLVTIGGAGTIAPAALAAGAGLCALAFALSGGAPTLRVWLTATSMAWAMGFAGQAADLGIRAEVLGFAAIGVVLVGVPVIVRTRRAAHLGIVGHMVTIGALGVSVFAGGWTVVLALAAFTAASAMTTAAWETAGSPVTDLLVDAVGPAAGAVPAVFAVAALPALVVILLDRAGVVTGRPVSLLELSTGGVVYAVLARLLVKRRPLASVLAWGAFVLALVAASGENHPVGAAAATAGIVVVLLVPAVLRRAPMTWVAWGLTGLLVVHLGALGGVAAGDVSWTILAAAALLCALSALLGQVARQRHSRTRWDLAPFVVAHGLTAIALVAAGASAAVTPIYASAGMLSLVVAAWRRHWAWALAGVLLMDFGVGRAGVGWLAIALAATSATATVAASRARRPATQAVLQLTAAAGAGAAWVAAARWRNATMGPVVSVSALIAGGLVLGLVVALRYSRLSRTSVAAWCLPALFGLSACAALAAGLPSRPAGLAVAGGVALVAVAAALAAAEISVGWLRDTAALLLAGAVTIGSVALGSSQGWAVALAGMIGLLATGVAVAIFSRRPSSPWVRPAIVLAGLATVAATVVGIAALPSRGLLAPALVVAGLEAAALGLVLGRLTLMALSPVLLSSALFVFASEALSGNPEWFAVPIGFIILVDTAFGRAGRRRTGKSASEPALVALDYLGMAFVVVAPLVQTIAGSPVLSLLGAALGAASGVAIASWGAITRVRRRGLFGAATVLLSTILLIAVPLGKTVPQLRGGALWITIATLGLVAILAAELLEQGRTRMRHAVSRLHELTADWQ